MVEAQQKLAQGDGPVPGQDPTQSLKAVAGRAQPAEQAERSPGDVAVSWPVRWEMAAYLLLIAIALGMRLWALGDRAMHHDESMHAWFSWAYAQGGDYRHDPLMHGPFQFHANAFIFFLLGDSDVTARLLYVLFGTALVGLPWFLRGQLGRVGAFVTAVLLAFSPTMLYFSRFTRNDILMAVWIAGLVVCIWRYLQDQRPRYLYLFSGLLALAFATKETVYLSVLVLGLFLFFVAQAWRRETWRRRALERPAVLLLLLVSLSLPQWSAMVSLFQGPLGLTLANPDWLQGPVGLPKGQAAIAVVSGITGLTVMASAALGLWWNPRQWLLCAGIFYGIWLLLYTSLFTNAYGVVTGMWQGLAYWVVQQDVARGGQPWFYYLVTGWTYEFLPFAVGLMGAIWYVRRGDVFALFLVFWALGSFLLFTWAAEKMPWLLVHVALPFIFLAGRTLGDLAERVPWRTLARADALVGLALLPLWLYVVYRLLFLQPERTVTGFFVLWGWLLLGFGLLLTVFYFATKAGWRPGLALVGGGLLVILFILTVRAGWRVTYRSGDVPTELLVYTQTSPDVMRIVRDIHAKAQQTGQGAAFPIVVDGDDGFAWPWHWYLRHYQQVTYTSYNSVHPQSLPKGQILLVNAHNQERAQQLLAEGVVQVRRYPHRWWFPESYRGITAETFFRGLADRKAWRSVLDYWLFRKFQDPLGSSDAYLYYAKELTAQR